MSTKDGRLWYALRGLPGKPQVATVVLMIALIALAVRRYISPAGGTVAPCDQLFHRRISRAHSGSR